MAGNFLGFKPDASKLQVFAQIAYRYVISDHPQNLSALQLHN